MYVPLRVVDLGVLAKQLLLAALVGPEASDLVSVFLGLQERNQVDAGPHLFAGELTVLEGEWLAVWFL